MAAKAKAPRPGSTKAKAKAEQDPYFKIIVRGDEAIIRPGDFGPRDDALVRKEGKKADLGRLSLMGALGSLDEDSVGLDSICLLWWIARRKAGDTTQSLATALDNFPSYGEADEHIDVIEISPDEDDEDDDSGNG